MSKWIKSTHPGVRYRMHPTRKYNRQKDKYFEIRFQRNGKTISEALGWLSDGMTIGEAAALRGQLLQNIRKGVSPQSVAEMREIGLAAKQAIEDREEAAKLDRFTFGAAAGLFLKWSETNKKSFYADNNRYQKYLGKRFKDTPIRDISEFDLEKLKSFLKKKGLSASTICQYLQLVRAIFNKTRAWGQHDCRFPAVKFPKVSNQRVAFLTPAQAQLLLKTVKEKSLRLWCQSVLGLYAGLRFGEIAALEIPDINLEAGTIHIRDSKGGTRHAYLTDPIEDMLSEWWSCNGKESGLVFPYRNGAIERRVSYLFGLTVEELGFNNGVTDKRQRIVFHSLRHTFASWLVMGGESLYTVKELMGHKDIQTTMRYSHLAPDIKRNAVDNLVTTLSQKSDDENKVVNLADKK